MDEVIYNVQPVSMLSDMCPLLNQSYKVLISQFLFLFLARHKSPTRKWRHMSDIVKSSAMQRLLFPDLATVGAISIGISYYNSQIATDVASTIAVHGNVLAGASTAIGILAAWRVNASYGRFDEGRKFWGEINNTSRDLAGNACMWLKTPELRDRMLKLIKAFAVVTHFHLNEKGGHKLLRRSDPDFQDKKYTEFYYEILDIYQDEEHFDFCNIVNMYKNGGHLPLSVSSYMRELITQNHELGVDPMYNREMDEQIQRLVLCLGQAERVLRTPLPTCFTRHTSRLFFLWSTLVPLTLYDNLGPVGTLPASLLICWAVLGIADIGVQLEEPFSILPIRQYSDGIFDGVNAIEKAYDVAADYTANSGAAGITASTIPGGAGGGLPGNIAPAKFIDFPKNNKLD